jgi:hypothetical protein
MYSVERPAKRYNAVDGDFLRRHQVLRPDHDVPLMVRELKLKVHPVK